MIYPESIVLNELMWEYDYTEKQAQALIDRYKLNNDYELLCDLIEHKQYQKFDLGGLTDV